MKEEVAKQNLEQQNIILLCCLFPFETLRDLNY